MRKMRMEETTKRTNNDALRQLKLMHIFCKVFAMLPVDDSMYMAGNLSPVSELIIAEMDGGDTDLHGIVDSITTHYDEIFRLKGFATKADVFHILSSMWKTPAERCFLWLGGFRPSKLLKFLVNHLEPLTEQQMVGICNLQESSQQAEDALSQGMEALQQSLVETLAFGSPRPAGSSGNVANYLGQMAMAMGKLGTLENFLRQITGGVFSNLKMQS